jgi:hypothetical protein
MMRKAVIFDLMQPLAAGWQFVGFGWEARRDEPGREGMFRHVEKVKSRNDYCNLSYQCTSFLLGLV